MIDQIAHERQVSALVSTLAVASISHDSHPEENSLSSPNVNLVYTKSEQNPSVSYWYKYVLAVTDV